MDGVWQEFGSGYTVGYKRLLRGSVVEAQKIRVTITEAQALPLLTKISLYKTPTLSKKEAVQQLEFSEKSLAVTKGEKFLAADNFGMGASLTRYLGRENYTFVMAEYEQQNMPYRSYNVKLKDALLQVGYMQTVQINCGRPQNNNHMVYQENHQN